MYNHPHPGSLHTIVYYLTRGAGWSSSSESDMLERSVAAPQSSRPSQIATECAGTGQAAGDKTAEATKSCSATRFDQKYSNNQWKMTHVTGHLVLSWKLLNSSSFLFIYYMFHVFYYVSCILCLTLCVLCFPWLQYKFLLKKNVMFKVEVESFQRKTDQKPAVKLSKIKAFHDFLKQWTRRKCDK